MVHYIPLNHYRAQVRKVMFQSRSMRMFWPAMCIATDLRD